LTVPRAIKRVLLVQPSLQPPGGGKGVAAWIIEALKPDYESPTLNLPKLLYDLPKALFRRHSTC
jgi:hypothetical protein